MHNDGKFCRSFIEMVVPYQIKGIKEIFDIGFVRYKGRYADSIYFAVQFIDNHLGFLKYNVVRGYYVLDSLYYVVNGREELRFDVHGKLIARYLHFKQEYGIDVVKHKGLDFIDSYMIKDNDIRTFTERRDDLVRYSVIRKDSDQFKTFDKSDYEYLAITNKATVDRIKEMQNVTA